MNIEKIEHDDCVNVTLDTEEVKCLCEALYGAFYDNEDNPVFRKLYSELIIARDIRSKILYSDEKTFQKGKTGSD